jgi:hypothetical protein
MTGRITIERRRGAETVRYIVEDVTMYRPAQAGSDA